MADIVTVDYLLDLVTKLHESGNGDMKIMCLDNPLHEDEICINCIDNEMILRGYLFNLPIMSKIQKFCSDVEKAKLELYKENGDKFPYIVGQKAEMYFEDKWHQGTIYPGCRFRDGIVTILTDEGKKIWCGEHKTDLYRQIQKK